MKSNEIRFRCKESLKRRLKASSANYGMTLGKFITRILERHGEAYAQEILDQELLAKRSREQTIRELKSIQENHSTSIPERVKAQNELNKLGKLENENNRNP